MRLLSILQKSLPALILAGCASPEPIEVQHGLYSLTVSGTGLSSIASVQQSALEQARDKCGEFRKSLHVQAMDNGGQGYFFANHQMAISGSAPVTTILFSCE
jgi:hypothetical protein